MDVQDVPARPTHITLNNVIISMPLGEAALNLAKGAHCDVARIIELGLELVLHANARMGQIAQQTPKIVVPQPILNIKQNGRRL